MCWVGAEDLDVGRDLEVAGGGVARAPLVEAHGHRLVAVHPEEEVLQVEDEVGDVLLHPRQGGELVEGVVEADLGDRRARDRRQQGAAEGVAERVAEAGVERADGEPLAVVLFFADGFDGGSLDDEHADQGSSAVWLRGVGGGRADVGGAVVRAASVRAGYLEYSSTMSCSCTGSSMCSRRGRENTRTSKPVAHRLQPRRKLAVEGVHVAADVEQLTGRGLEGHHVALADPVAGDGDPLAVDQHVAVAHELAGLGPAGPPAGPEGHVVETQLEHAEQVLAGDARGPAGLHVEVVELLLEQAVDPAGLLLLPQLGQVLRALAHAVATVLARRVGAAVRSVTASETGHFIE